MVSVKPQEGRLKMKKLKIKTFMAAVALTMSATVTIALAAQEVNLVVSPNPANDGAIVSPADGSAEKFVIKDMYPGDKQTLTLSIANNDTVNQGFSYSLFVKNTWDKNEAEWARWVADTSGNLAKNTDTDILTPDLAKAIDLKVTGPEGNVIYAGTLAGFYGTADQLDSEQSRMFYTDGDLRYQDKEIFSFEVELPGETTDNRYQRAYAEFEIAIVTESYNPPTTTTTTITNDPTDDPVTTNTTPGTTTPAGNAQTTPADATQQTDPMTVDANAIPLAPQDEAPPSDPDLMELDDDVPLAQKEMPQTGELSLLYYIMAGILIAAAGVYIMMRGRKKNAARQG